MLGGHARLQKTTMVYNSPNNQPLNNTLWVDTDLNAPNPFGVAWAEIGYGYGAGVPGPYWYYYYVRQNGTIGQYRDLPFDESANWASFDIELYWSSSGGTYRGKIGGTEAMFATGLGDCGVFHTHVGVEASSCHDVVYAAFNDGFTNQNQSGTWTAWLSGTQLVNSPAYSNWSGYPTSGYVGIN